MSDPSGHFGLPNLSWLNPFSYNTASFNIKGLIGIGGGVSVDVSFALDMRPFKTLYNTAQITTLDKDIRKLSEDLKGGILITTNETVGLEGGVGIMPGISFTNTPIENLAGASHVLQGKVPLHAEICKAWCGGFEATLDGSDPEGIGGYGVYFAGGPVPGGGYAAGIGADLVSVSDWTLYYGGKKGPKIAQMPFNKKYRETIKREFEDFNNGVCERIGICGN